ncbi:MAG: helix-turn-helix transcriptional regulator [Terriglobia bacterium]
MIDFQIPCQHAPALSITDPFRHVLFAVHERFRDSDLSLRTLSREAGISERHLARLFQRHLGKTFRQYLREIRIHEAAALLEHLTDEVKIISGLVGYTYPSYFGRDFRLLMNCTPTQFRITQCNRVNAMSNL